MSDVGSVSEWQKVAEDTDDKCQPLFYMKEVKDVAKSRVENRVCYKMVEYVEIFVPGEKNLRPNRPITDEDKRRWPDQYRRFQETREEEMEGTPISQWPYLDRAGVAEMTANGFPTVELVAACPDGSLNLLGANGNEVRKRAQHFLKPQPETERDLRAEIDELQSSLKNTQIELENANKKIEAFEVEAQKPARAPRKKAAA